jgi:hypothetical protein
MYTVMAPKYRTMTEHKKVAFFGRCSSTITMQHCLEPEKSSSSTLIDSNKQSKRGKRGKGEITVRIRAM